MKKILCVYLLRAARKTNTNREWENEIIRYTNKEKKQTQNIYPWLINNNFVGKLERKKVKIRCENTNNSKVS